MRKKVLAVSAVLFTVLLLSPVALANVYVPPGPAWSMDAWISPNLSVVDLQTLMPIGWVYSDGPMYDPITQMPIDKIEKWNPVVQPWQKLDIPWGTEVMVVGFIPKVYVSPDQVPPPVELVITWNGIPYVVTLKLPATQIVGYDYPPKFYPDIKVPYEFAWPQESPYKDAYYNIWVGDYAHILEHFGLTVPPEWFETGYGMMNGYWFWYRFYPNVGDWIAYDCQGETKFPPTYDITALFEYSTSQIWFNHVCFDVSLLEVHKTVGWATKPWPEGNMIIDTVTIENVGKENATELDFTQTFPSDLKHGVIPDYASAIARIDGDRRIGWTPLKDFGTSWPYVFPSPFDYLDPGEVMTIYLELKVFNLDNWKGTIVFDSMVSAHEIPPWKEPIALHSITIGFVQRFVVMIGDAPAHAAPSGIGSFNEPTAWGGDPGPDEIMGTPDDLDYFKVIRKIAAEGITVFTVDYGYWYDAWLNFEYIAKGTGGVHYYGGDSWDVAIANEIQNRIGAVGRGDIVFTIDLTSSMGWCIGDVKSKVKSLIDSLPPTLDVTFGLGTHVDYPNEYNSYGYWALYGEWPDYAWLMNLDLTADRSLVKNTVNALTLYWGADWPQDYARVLYETQFFSWRGQSAMWWTPLWTGWKLYWEYWGDKDGEGTWKFGLVVEWWVPTPILRDELTHPPPKMTLDPVPVDLNGDGVINAEDVALVRQAIVGLIPYDHRMDINANGKIDTQDLAAYKLSS